MVTLKVHEYLDAHQITQGRLARQLGATKQYVSELGHQTQQQRRGVSLRQLARICDCLAALGAPCRPEDLFEYRRGNGQIGPFAT